MSEHDQSEIFHRLRKSEDRLTRIETVLWGTDGKNGLRSDIRELKQKMDMLLRFFWVATAIPPLAISVLGILKFLGKL